MAELKELPIPTPAQQAQRAVEILRVWINDDKSMHTSLTPAFYETGTWGILLVRLTHQVAEAYAQQTGLNKDDVIESIRAVYASAFVNPQAPPAAKPKK